MRIAIVTVYGERIGGAETYIDSVLGGLAAMDQELALFCESDEQPGRPKLTLPPESPLFNASREGTAASVKRLREWRPDLLYVHGLKSSTLESAILEIAPAVFYLHNYNGTCVSGTKTFRLPSATPCTRKFGPYCLLEYYPRRCGGLNPLTMWRQYQLQSARLNLLHRYRRVLANSEHMAAELRNNGISAQCLYLFPESDDSAPSEAFVASSPTGMGPLRLLYLGRMDYLKGCRVLLDALPSVNSRLNREVQLTFAGSGTELAKLERHAQLLERQHHGVKVQFAGWVDARGRAELFGNTDLLVLPSLWPEPFGLVGIEAGLCGVPCAAFAVGGIPEWLSDGVNGCLAAGGLNAGSLSDAIVRAVSDEGFHRQLRIGAWRRARQFKREEHFRNLMDVFHNCGCSEPQSEVKN